MYALVRLRCSPSTVRSRRWFCSANSAVVMSCSVGTAGANFSFNEEHRMKADLDFDNTEMDTLLIVPNPGSRVRMMGLRR
jgi:hypothetical protein